MEKKVIQKKSVIYISKYVSPIGTLTISADDTALTGLWIDGQKNFGSTLSGHKCIENENTVIKDTKLWLDKYFAGKMPKIEINVKFEGTDFQKRIWNILRNIPYGRTVTYADIAQAAGSKSPRAAGNAIGKNPISIIVPCHRVISATGKLTGYAGGLDAKAMLLRLEEKK